MRFVVDVGGTKTILAVVNAQRQVLSKRQFPTDQHLDIFLDHLIKEINAQLTADNASLEAIVVAVPGNIDYPSRKLTACGNLDWINCDIAGRLETAFSAKVIIENDANLGAIGEARHGAGQGYDVVLYITISTGIGSGVTVAGRIDPVLAHAEAGQLLLPHGDRFITWEHLASGKAFVEKYGQYGRDVSDPAIWQQYAPDVALGIINLAAIIQPDIVVIGGSMGEHFAKYQQFLSDSLVRFKQQLPTVKLPRVVAASDPDGAVIKGGMEVLSDLLDQG